MSFLTERFLAGRAAFRLTSTTLRPAARLAAAPRVQARFASQDYGSGDGNPAGEKPQEQSKNPMAHLEHPGPEAPKVGQNKSSSPNEGSGGESKSSSSSSSSSSDGSGSEVSSGQSSAQHKGADQPGTKKDVAGVKGAQPKILNENPPGEKDESVRKHNEEMDNRYEKTSNRVSNEDAKKDKAPPGFWSGQGGRDKDP